MKLSLLIAHYNALPDLERCLRSIAATAGGLEHEIIVVDNASSAVDGIPQRFPEIRWLQNSENLGYGRAMNRAAAEASGDVLVFLNPDVELLPRALLEIKNFIFETTGPVGAVGGELLFSDGRVQPSCGPFPSLLNLLWRRALNPARRRHYLRTFHRPRQADWVSGAFLAIRRPIFEWIGGFDPGFFLYYEDVDLCRRAHALGLPSYYLPQARAYHHKPHALRKGADPQLESVIRDSRLRYFDKHRPVWESWALQRLS